MREYPQQYFARGQSDIECEEAVLQLGPVGTRHPTSELLSLSQIDSYYSQFVLIHVIHLVLGNYVDVFVPVLVLLVAGDWVDRAAARLFALTSLLHPGAALTHSV